METEYFASINEVSKRLDVPAHTLRYWEKQFPTMIRPTTGAGGRRYYRAEMVDRLFVIKDLLYNRGMTIAGVKKIMRENAVPCAPSPEPCSHHWCLCGQVDIAQLCLRETHMCGI